MNKANQNKMPCKYGKTCRFLITNTCHFYHPPQNENYQQSRSNYYAHPNPYSPHPERRGMSKGKNSNFYQQTNQLPKYQSSFSMHRNPSNGGKKQQSVNQKSLCRFFHFGNTCKFGNKCQRKHQFMFGESETMRRILHRRDIPQNAISRMSKIECGEQQVISIRVGSQVFVLKYQFQTNELGGGQKVYQLPAIKAKYQYYAQRDQYIYYSSENQLTKFADFGFHDLLTKETVWVSNCHSDRLTGILHYDQQTLYSSSMGGEIKVWSNSQQGYVFNKQMTEHIVSFYNAQNKIMEILFLNIEIVDQNKIMSAGTNDGRVLFWSANNTQFMQLNVQGYNKVYKQKLIKLYGTNASIVLAWNTTNNSSAILLFNLQSEVSMVIKQVVGQNGNNCVNMHTFEYIDDYLFIGNIKGEVSIYDIKQQVKQVGAILHQNMISDIICSHLHIKTTGVSLKIIYLLEKRKEEIEGSFSIYMLH